jgi:Uma2 family endonuclease
MTTLLKLGPADHGRPVTSEELSGAEYHSGYHYEVIEGKLYVSPLANFPEGWVNRWINLRLELYALGRPDILNFVCTKTRVFVPNQPAETVPEPDVAVYHDFPLDQSPDDIRWQDVSPILVVEVLSEGDPDKDLKRNVRLYRLVPSIREYWILDAREGSEQPSMRVYRRQGSRWRRIDIEAGATYTTKLLPGFELTLNTRQ